MELEYMRMNKVAMLAVNKSKKSKIKKFSRNLFIRVGGQDFLGVLPILFFEFIPVIFSVVGSAHGYPITLDTPPFVRARLESFPRRLSWSCCLGLGDR